jgi:drug/metabolite transporter (DMT)-like permease
MIAAVLALCASLIWGTSDFAAGVLGRRTTVWGVVLLSQLAGFTATGLVVAALGHPFPPLAGWLPAVLAGLSGIVAVTSFYTALSIGVMSIVAPVSSTGILVPVLVGLALGERPSTLQFAGMALAVAGVILASREPGPASSPGGLDEPGEFVPSGPAGAVSGPHRDWPDPADIAVPPDAAHAFQQPPRRRPALLRAPRSAATLSFILALVAAASIGASYVGMGYAAEYDSYWGVFLMRATSAPLVLLTFLIVRPRLGVTRRSILPIVLVGVGDTTANTLFAVASTYGYLSVVGVLGYLYPIITVLLAHALLHERLARIQQLAAGAALAGAILVAA